MRPYGSPKTLEKRRRRAVALLAPGLSLREVARRVQASGGSVSQWRQAWASGGEASLAAKPVPGRPRKLTDQPCQQLLQLLLKGARAYGFPNELWTLKRMATVIWLEFRVRYHPAHVWKVLRSWHWSCQVPERRAIQRDEQAIVRWQRYKGPAIKKSPKTWRPSRVPRRKRLSAHSHASSDLGACRPNTAHLLQRHT
jgi:transposase